MRQWQGNDWLVLKPEVQALLWDCLFLGQSGPSLLADNGHSEMSASRKHGRLPLIQSGH